MRFIGVWVLLVATAAQAQATHVKTINAQPLTPTATTMSVLAPVAGDALIGLGRVGSGFMLARANPSASGLTFIESGLDLNARAAIAFGSHAIIENNGYAGLWLVDTDGSLAGTTPLPSNIESSQGTEATLGAKVLYGVGAQVWAWDGATSTLLVTRASTGTLRFQVAGTKAYFLDTGPVLRGTDGTPAGTSIVTGACDGPTMTLVGQLNGKLLYACTTAISNNELRLTDGVSAPVTLFTGATAYTVRNVGSGKLLVRVANGSTASLYVTDGTPASTAAVSLPSPPNTTYVDLGPAVNGKALIIASSSASATPVGLLAYDGTTSTVLDAALSPMSGTPYVLTPTGVLFLANEPSVNDPIRVWTTDGTAAGTQVLAGVGPADQSNPGLSGVKLASSTIFSLNDDTLYVVNASGVATVLFQVPRDLAQSGALAMTSLGTRVLFGANDGLSGEEPWTSDGTSAGTFRLGDLFPGPSDGFASSGFGAGTAAGTGLTLYWGTSAATGTELWVTDGGATSQLVDLVAGPAGASPQTRFISAGDDLYFVATGDDAGQALFRSDGTTAGTRPVLTGLASNSAFTLQPYGRDLVYWDAPTDTLRRFHADDGGVEVLFSHGPGNHQVPLKVVGRRIWFQSWTSTGLTFVSDGTRASALQAFDAGPNVRYGDTDWAPVGTGYVTWGRDVDAGQEPWAFDLSSGPRLLADVYPGPADSSLPEKFTAAGGKVFFTARDAVHGRELWVTDGTPAGTTLVKDIGPGPWSGIDDGTPLFAVGNTVYFSATDGVRGFELWRSDGTAAGTVQAAEVNANAPGSTPRQFGTAGCALEFFGVGADRRDDLWSLPLPSPAPLTITHTITGQSDGGWYRGLVTVEFDVESTGPVQRCPLEEVSTDTAGTTFTCSATTPCGGATATDTVVIRRDEGKPYFTSCDAGPYFVEASGPDAGFLPSYEWPVVKDDISTATLSTDPDLRLPLPLGETGVRTTATDEAGNTAAGCVLDVRVRDTTPPVLLCPADIVTTPTAPGGTTVPDAGGGVVVHDAVDPSPEVTLSVPRDHVYPVGQTVVTVSATDASGNRSSCPFTVTVTAPVPTITCPASVTASAASEKGAPITFEVDARDPFGEKTTPTLSAYSGSIFPIGTTSVTATVTDSSGAQSASCTFDVTVTAKTLPRYGFGCASASAGPLGLVALVLLGLRRRRLGARGAVLVAALAAGSALADAAIPVQGKTAAFMGISPGPGIDAKTAETLSSVVEAKLAARGYAQLTSQTQIATLLGVERQKQLLGCSDGNQCIEELGGALNATHVITGSLGLVEGSVVCTLSLIDTRSTKALGRVTRRARSGGVDAIIDELPDMLDVLYSGNVGSTGEATASTRGLIVGARVDGDVYGGLAATAANVPIAPGLTVEWSDKRFGVAGTLFAQTRVGGRVEGRLFFTESGLRPWLALGGAGFLDGDVGGHVSVGAGTHFGPVHVALDAGFEYFPRKSLTVERLAGLVGLRVGMRL